MTDANITVEDIGNNTKIAHVSGQLDESNIDEKIQEIYKLIEQTPKGLRLIFDLEHLEYMNSKSIGYLTDLYGKITETGGKVMIAKAQSNIIDILQVVGLTQLIESFDTVDLAKASLSQTPTLTQPAQPVAQPQVVTTPIATPQVVQPQQTPTPIATTTATSGEITITPSKEETPPASTTQPK